MTVAPLVPVPAVLELDNDADAPAPGLALAMPVLALEGVEGVLGSCEMRYVS